MGITHATTATGTDAGTGEIHKAQWNADHVVSDPIFDQFGAPDTAFEFETSSLTGLTSMGSPTAEDANTTIPGHYYVKRTATSSVAASGRYASAPSTPFTVITKLGMSVWSASNYQRAGFLFIGEATPGKLEAVAIINNNGIIGTLYAFTNPTTFSANIGTDVPGAFQTPAWFAIVATSGTSVAYYYSFDGYLWRARQTARNPGFTIGSVGIGVDPENATFGAAAGYDYLRIWNSAKTLVTVG